MVIKRVLITGGPTQVAIDEVRVISNIATGETAKLLAEEAKKRNIDARLILGPLFFDEFLNLVKKEIASKRYDFIIHAAAVSDYQLAQPFNGKIASGKNNLILKLKPTPKIVEQIRKWDSNIFLVMFKLETGVSDAVLISRAKNALVKADANLVVANRIKPTYKAFILDKDKVYYKADSKKEMARRLFDVIEGF